MRLVRRRSPISQVAALPYRTEGSGAAARIQVMLVTSRGSGRWVVPKGNIPARMSPHEAAAQEAEEEAGVRGAVCPTPLGSYRYRKLRGSGASLMVDVDVYPLALTSELANWKEEGERTRRWFTLLDAAAVVEEPELAELIRAFRP